MKKHIALAIAAVLSLALVAPVFAQPFADVPAEHWAFDAIAELAAKGILEGYPDGTFKGDRAMTRYEMAMALARILARIEAIKIPPPPKIPPPEVRAADIARLQRLINEFRAELSALGVRITALEEELAALRARLDNTFITGDWTYVYVTGDGTGFFTSTPWPEVQRNRIRLTFRGRLSPEFQVFLRARWNSRYIDGHITTVDFDRLRADWASPWAGMVFSLGREYWSLGPQGYLLSILTSREGGRVTGSFGGIGWTVLGFWNSGGAISKTYGLRAVLPAFAGWTFGVNYRRDTWVGFPTFNSSGWSVDWEGSLMSGFTLSGEYATWSYGSGWFGTACPVFGVVGEGCTALYVNLAVNLGQLTGVSQFNPSLNIFYKNIGAGYFGPPFALGGGAAFCGGLATLCNIASAAYVHQANWLGGYSIPVNTWGVDLTLNLSSRLTALIAYETGRDNNFVPGNTLNSVLARATYTLSRNATAEVEYNRLNFTAPGFTPFTASAAAFRVFFRW